MGVGYGSPGRLTDSADYQDVIDRWSGTPMARGSRSALNTLAHRVAVGDYVWTQDRSKYYLGRVTGEWRYSDSPEARRFDLYNVRACDWLEEPFAGWDVPGKVVRSFSGRGGPIQRVKNEVAETVTDLLWRRATDPSLAKTIIPASTVLRDLLDPIDVEDVVLLYLQFHGWLLMPSTRMHDTPVYEAAFRGREGSSTAVVSVKSGGTKVPLEALATAAAGGAAFAFSTERAYEGDAANLGVQLIDPEVICDFMERHPDLMPTRVTRWLEGS
jgi:hypothetical protein